MKRHPLTRAPRVHLPKALLPAEKTGSEKKWPPGSCRQRQRLLSTALIFLLIGGFAPAISGVPLQAAELEGRIVTLRYQAEADLQRFNRMLYPGKEISLKLQQRHLLSVHDEVVAKIELLTERIESVLEMRPSPYHFTLELFTTPDQAQAALVSRTGIAVNFISFYSRRENTIYLAVANTTLRLVAHEIAHVVTEHYFSPSPPGKIHEIMAQYAAMHLLD